MSAIKAYIVDDDGYFLYSRTSDIETVLRAVEIEQVEYTLTPPPDDSEGWQWVGTEWVMSDKNIAKKKIADQKTIWQNIKSMRYQIITSGVYVPSINKVLHTDEVAATQYSQISSSILLGTFKPLMWKAMDGTFFEMNEAVFKELQSEMIAHTQDNYAKAEFHKAVMQMMDDPLDYDYSDGWITCKKPNEATE